MIAIIFEKEIELRIWLTWSMLVYPIHFYNPIILKVAVTELNCYWFNIVDAKG